MKVVINDACINCGTCVDACPVDAIHPKGTKHEINGACIQCENCIGTCPVEAIVKERGK